MSPHHILYTFNHLLKRLIASYCFFYIYFAYFKAKTTNVKSYSCQKSSSKVKQGKRNFSLPSENSAFLFYIQTTTTTSWQTVSLCHAGNRRVTPPHVRPKICFMSHVYTRASIFTSKNTKTFCVFCVYLQSEAFCQKASLCKLFWHSSTQSEVSLDWLPLSWMKQFQSLSSRWRKMTKLDAVLKIHSIFCIYDFTTLLDLELVTLPLRCPPPPS